MTTTATRPPTAREVVADYLAAKAETDKPKQQAEIVTGHAVAIIDELPDRFTEKDVRVCVGAMSEGNPELDGMTTSRRNRAIRTVLNDSVADGALKLDGDEYTHTS